MFLSYYNYFSILSIIIIVSFIIVVYIGFKVGFLTKFLKIANSLCGFIFSVLLCNKFATYCLYPLFGSTIEGHLKENILKSDVLANVGEGATASEVLSQLGIPEFLSKPIADKVNSNDIVNSISETLASTMSHFIVVVISFLVLLIGTSILFGILKIAVKGLRESKAIRVADGILGAVFFALLFYVALNVIFLVVMLLSQTNMFSGPMEWITNDMLLGKSNFRISKWFYENNLLGAFFKMFFNI